jgi:NAD(P) transhydrogenase subunit beta
MLAGLSGVAYVGAVAVFVMTLAVMRGSVPAHRRVGLYDALAVAAVVIVALFAARVPTWQQAGTLILGAAAGAWLGREPMMRRPVFAVATHGITVLCAVLGASSIASQAFEPSPDLALAAFGSHAEQIQLGVLLGTCALGGAAFAAHKMRGAAARWRYRTPDPYTVNLLAAGLCAAVGYAWATSALAGHAALALVASIAIGALIGAHVVAALAQRSSPSAALWLNGCSGGACALLGLVLGDGLLVVTGTLLGWSWASHLRFAAPSRNACQ